MSSGRYASQTTVPAERSRAEIERTLKRYGADAFIYGYDGSVAMIGFRHKYLQIRFTLPVPSEGDVARTPKGRARHRAALPRMIEQETRRRWRSLANAIKAKLDTVESGITTFETEFQPYIMLPDGRTVAEWLGPQIEEIYRTGRLPPLLPAPPED